MDFRDLAKVPHKHFYSKHLVISGAGLAYGFARIRSVPLDTAKRVFQLHWIDMETGDVEQRCRKRTPQRGGALNEFVTKCV